MQSDMKIKESLREYLQKLMEWLHWNSDVFLNEYTGAWLKLATA